MSDFDFIEHYGDSEEVKGEEQLDENEVISSLNCAFIVVVSRDSPMGSQ